MLAHLAGAVSYSVDKKVLVARESNAYAIVTFTLDELVIPDDKERCICRLGHRAGLCKVLRAGVLRIAEYLQV